MPSLNHLKSIAGNCQLSNEFANDNKVNEKIVKELTNHAIKSGLGKYEIPAKFTLIREPWTPESGIITSAFKLKRKVIQDLYQKEINQMYKSN